MHLLEHLHRNVKTVAMPTAMVVGALLCRPISALEELKELAAMGVAGAILGKALYTGRLRLDEAVKLVQNPSGRGKA